MLESSFTAWEQLRSPILCAPIGHALMALRRFHCNSIMLAGALILILVCGVGAAASDTYKAAVVQGSFPNATTTQVIPRPLH